MNGNSMLNRIINQLGENYKSDDEHLIKSNIDNVTAIALSISNRRNTYENINLLSPYIEQCVIAEYLNRGSEGVESLSEGGRSSSFKDNRAIMRKNIIRDGLRICF